jgi:hypothetical protein
MRTQNGTRSKRWILVAALAGLIASWLAVTGPAAAGDLAELDTSLKLVPKTAAFYSSSMRLGEQVEIAANSRAWAKLKSLPSVQEALALYEKQKENEESPAAKFEQAKKLPPVADLIGLAKDMFAQEAFFFGDEQYPTFIELLQNVGNAVQYGPMVAELSGDAEGVDKEKLQAKLLLTALAENVDSMVVPTTILGFKITDKEQAQRNVTNLAGLLTVACMAATQLNGAFRPTQIGDDTFSVLSLNGEMIPWDEIPLDEVRQIENTPGDVDKVVARIKKMTLVLAVGIRGDYLMVSIGPSTDCLAALGSGELLTELPEFKRLEKFSDKRLASIGYVSRQMNERAATSEADVDRLVELLKEVLPQAELSDADQKEVLDDARMLADDLKKLMPRPGAAVACSFLTDKGVEGYSYNWTENLMLDGSKPLTLLEHVGGNPLLAAVWRERYAPENYDLVAKWAVIGYRYFEKYAVPEMSSHDRKEYERFKELVRPLPGRIDRANRELLIPALADSQGAFVLDAKLKIRKLFKDMPDPGKAMPMVEPALVVGVSDAELLRKGCNEYLAVFSDLLDAIREVDPGSIPEFEMPEPKVTETDAGTIYSYVPPKHCGVDKKIVPSIGLSDSVAVLALTQNHAERLLSPQSPTVGGVLTKSDRARAVAFLFDFAGLIRAARPWVDLAAREVIRRQMHVSDEPTDPQKAQMESMLEQVNTVLDVLSVLRNVTVEARIENGVTVTHSLVVIRDVE